MFRTSVIGLGKLGACMAACFAHKGFETIGVDLNPKSVAAVNNGEAPVDETGLSDMIAACKTKLKATTDYAEAIQNSDATFVIVPTPSESNGSFSLKYARESFKEIGRALKNKKGYHLVVMTSTVLPGGTELGLLPVLEKESGKKCGTDFGLCYSPEFIALGSVIRDFLNPDFVLIGESDKKAGDMLESFYEKISDNHAPAARMNIMNAELTKVSVNSFMTMKISFANMLAALCEQLPGGNVNDVTKALGLFGGVGKRSLNGGMGYGGPCLPRDNVALSYLAKSLNQEIAIPESVDRFNRSISERILNIVLKSAAPGSRVALLGLAYKPATWVIEESQGIELASLLADRGFNVVAYDPKAMESARQKLQEKIGYASSVEEALKDANVVVVTTPDAGFQNLPLSLLSTARKPVVIDVWRQFSETIGQNKAIDYVAIGIGPQNKQLTDRLIKLWN
ncbi:MAG: nucleotide sugar dehydrogenase [Deltaproteobacteria bacterium]|nr:nucleotide sugar dehydrogenase [Deltaproteobacteria bacterium]